MNSVFQLPLAQISIEWDKLKGFIEEALDQSKCDDYSIDDVYKQLISDNWKLYVVMENTNYVGAIVVSFIKYPASTVAYICAIGGKGVMRDNLVDSFFNQLKASGADRVQGAARPSVVRLWRRIGMYEKYSIVEKKL